MSISAPLSLKHGSAKGHLESQNAKLLVPGGSRMRKGPAARQAAVLAMAWIMSGCASLPPMVRPGDSLVLTTLAIGGSEVAVEWALPTGEATALITLQHGFSRHCSQLRETARRIAEHGLLTLCIEAPMARGNPNLADALAALLAGGLSAPGGGALPSKIIVGGHSAGAVFAARLGARLEVLAPQRLAGALLFDPVATESFADDLLTISKSGQRPVLAVTAAAGACNARHSAYPALRGVRRAAQAAGGDGFVGIELTEGSTHADVEGDHSDWMAAVACGRPLPANTERVRTLAAQWSAELATGSTPTRALPDTARAIE
jgi:pimeloyl-ACP methyl ester carboxylesterase